MSISSNEVREQVATALNATYGLTLLNGVLDDDAARAVLDLLKLLVVPEPDPFALATAYSRAFRELALAVHAQATPHLADAWQAYLVTRILDDNNLWSREVERVGAARVLFAIRAQARRDLHALSRLFRLDASSLWNLVRETVASALPELDDAWAPWCNLVPPSVEKQHQARNTLAQQAAVSTDWDTLIAPLEEYWSRHGTGVLARYTVLRWRREDKVLVGIAHPETTQLADLIGYEREKTLLKANIEHFLAGLPAHDALLYGAPGTGKSSTVKALANAYNEQGLRLIEIHREDLSDLPKVVATLRGRAPHFLLFIDDLSFEEHETGYKALKVLLEGTAEARPSNIVIHATSNRLNLVRENFSDRGKPSDDVHWRDTMDEKQALVHRFGLRVTFALPDQERYLAIVEGLAQQRGLAIPEEMLRTQALQWERQHVGRSGRLARQFVNDLEAELCR